MQLIPSPTLLRLTRCSQVLDVGRDLDISLRGQSQLSSLAYAFAQQCDVLF